MLLTPPGPNFFQFENKITLIMLIVVIQIDLLKFKDYCIVSNLIDVLVSCTIQLIFI